MRKPRNRHIRYLFASLLMLAGLTSWFARPGLSSSRSAPSVSAAKFGPPSIPGDSATGRGTLDAAYGDLLIDDFTTGPHQVTLPHGMSSRSEDETDVQSGSMIGGFRKTAFLIPSNPFNQHGTLDIRRGGPMLVDMGTRVSHRLELVYGFDSKGEVVAPLNLNLSDYDRFRLNFDSNDLDLNFNMLVHSNSGATHSVYKTTIHANTNPFAVGIPFGEFTGAADFTDVDLIVLVFQSSSAMGSNDFAVRSLVATHP
jgi:hypothetical protein